MDSSLEPPEGMRSYSTLILASLQLFQTHDFENCEMISLCCLVPTFVVICYGSSRELGQHPVPQHRRVIYRVQAKEDQHIKAAVGGNMVLHDKQLPDLCGLKQWKYIPESQVDRLMQFSHSIHINLYVIIWLGLTVSDQAMLD